MSFQAGTPGAISQPPSAAAYLGQGVAYPLAYNANTGRLNLSSGTQCVLDAVTSIMSTQPGERVMQPDYGADKFTFEPVDPGRAKIYLEQQLADHEPRVDAIADLRVEQGQTMNDMQIVAELKIQGQATPQTLTYPLFTPPAAT